MSRHSGTGQQKYSELFFKLSPRLIFHNEYMHRTNESPHKHEHQHAQENNSGSPKNGAMFIVIDFEHDSNTSKSTKFCFTITSSDDEEERR